MFSRYLQLDAFQVDLNNVFVLRSFCVVFRVPLVLSWSEDLNILASWQGWRDPAGCIEFFFKPFI